MKEKIKELKKIHKKIVNKKLPIKSSVPYLNEIRYIHALTALVVITTLYLMVWFAIGYCRHQFGNNAIVNPNPDDGGQVEEMCEKPRVLDGICLEDDNVKPRLVAVMLDNHMDARPQAGLSQASIVYEVPVEGNYTRFMAIYFEEEGVKKVGPVRSARPYFLDWLEEYGAPMYMHVGGSPEALQLIRDYKIFDFNEFSRGWYFWRDDNRYAPHNAFTSQVFWEKGFETYGETVELEDLYYEGWKFGDIGNCGEESECVNEIKITYLPVVFEPTWKYNSSTEKYKRFEGGQSYRDESGEEIIADNIIIQRVRATVIDEVGRLQIDTIGEGEVIVFTGGRAEAGIWKKPGREEKTRWYNDGGEEIVLKPGVTWIQVVSQNTEVEW